MKDILLSITSLSLSVTGIKVAKINTSFLEVLGSS